MGLRTWLRDFERGDNLRLFWRVFYLRRRVKSRLPRRLLTFLLHRWAHRHGGYVGDETDIRGPLRLPHGLHGIYLSRYARIGGGCCIYQNVTIGEVDGRAPQIGPDCLIGAGAVLHCSVPPYSTVVAQPPRILQREEGQV